MSADSTVKFSSGPLGGKSSRVIQRDGNEIKGITRVGVPSFGRGEPVKIVVELFAAEIVIEGKLVVRMIHPQTGESVVVAGIDFADGDRWEA